ncbi:MAG TPA: hypothetical protein VGB37_14520 [Candidatus Lokiarchaeia archaeon]
MLEKIKKKIFKREVTNFELFSTFIGLISGFIAIFGQIGFLSITNIGLENKILNPLITFLAILTLSLIVFFIYRKKKDWVLSSVILILGILIFISGTTFLTTVFNPSGQLGNIPLTQDECRQYGVIIPSSLNCAINYIEIGGSKDFICCMEDTCYGNWERVYNDNTKIFEFICQQS